MDVAELLIALPGEGDFLVGVPRGEFGIEPGSLFVGKVFGADLQGPADPVERISLASPVPSVSCWTRRRTSSTMAEPSFTTWKALCRCRHNAFYSDVLVMPMSAGRGCCRGVSGGGYLGITRVVRDAGFFPDWKEQVHALHSRSDSCSI